MSRKPDKSLLGLIGRLPADEYELMRMRHEHGMTPVQIANAMNAHHASIQKMLLRIEKRVRSPLFAFVSANYKRLPSEFRTFAKYRYIYGLPLREIANKLDCGLTETRVRDAAFKGAIQILCSTDAVGQGFVLRPTPPQRMKFNKRREPQFR